MPSNIIILDANHKMKVAYITAGAAGMYCGTCIHDNTVASVLNRQGHNVALIPTYTPTRTDEENVSLDRIFYGGLNVYLQQKLSLFRHTPWTFDRMLDSPSLLNSLARFSATTDARDLGQLTVSMLSAEQGYQRKELAKLVKWLQEDNKPDIVYLTNSMLIGMAREIKKALDVPVICALQGEDIFLRDLIDPYKTKALTVLSDRAMDADGFVAPCKYYAHFMAEEYLKIPIDKIDVVPLGLNLDGHGTLDEKTGPPPFTVGYLARICPEKGLHILVSAFYTLTKELGADNVELHVAGYLGKKDEAYFEELVKQIHAWGLQDSFIHYGEVTRAEKIDFMNRLHVFSVPTVYRESKGLPVLEALANGVPVVQPEHGSFPEMVKATEGGILVEPESAEALADGIYQLYRDSERRRHLGRTGKMNVHQNFSDEIIAQQLIKVFEKYL
ncbi:MAG: glycosyltransferase family 4 protein [Candidatus Poribacteria bacterium]|nr:glycosyltransferase family 4 protein [Candidatus Poribacteria bacterium]